MSQWQPIETAPKGKVLLLWGQFDPHPEERHHYGKPDADICATGYWDEIDDAWCLTGSTWTGPWIKATHWMPLPEPPTEAA